MIQNVPNVNKYGGAHDQNVNEYGGAYDQNVNKYDSH